jgi:hypothetical protein
MIGTALRRYALRVLAAPATLRAVLGLRRLAARAGREAQFQLWLQTAMAMLGRWVDPSPLAAEVNFHADRLAALARRPPGTETRARRAPRDHADGAKLRVAMCGHYSAALPFGTAFFAAVPGDIELAVFDISWHGIWAGWLAGSNHHYVRVDGSTEHWADTARRINAFAPDVLCVNISKPDLRLFAAIDAPCVANWNGGSVPFHGQLVDFELYPQYQRNYALADRRLVHLRTGVPIPDTVAYPCFWPYDPREGALDGVLPAARRGPDIFFHGSLYKLVDRNYLDLVFRVMADIPAARLRFMAKRGAHDDLDPLFERARARGVADRVEYLEAYDNVRGIDGAVADEGWQLCRRELARARLWLGTFPGVGASARVEAYQSGAPVVQMGFPPDWTRSGVPIHNAWELPHLRVEIGTATNPADYEILMRRVLLDDAFAQQVADAQYARLPEILDQGRIWRDFRVAYADWLSRLRDAG